MNFPSANPDLKMGRGSLPKTEPTKVQQLSVAAVREDRMSSHRVRGM